MNYLAMIDAKKFLEACEFHEIRLITGVPCSDLAALINAVCAQNNIRYVAAANEGESVGIAAGAALAGCRAAVICQNSGLGNMVNPLTSLIAPFRIPILLFSTWRGRPGIQDEPQHRLMGKITKSILKLMHVRHDLLPMQDEKMREAMSRAVSYMEKTHHPYCFLIAHGTFADVTAPFPPFEPPQLLGEISDYLELLPTYPTRAEVLRRLVELVPNDVAIVATTGYCGRELFTLSDRKQHFYLVGSMGCASAVGLGIALNSCCLVVVLDGDGAALMKLGNLSTIGCQSPTNYIHILLDNGMYESTGGQPSASRNVDFPAVARAAGYRTIMRCNTLDGFSNSFLTALKKIGPIFVHVRIVPGTLPFLIRPTVAPSKVTKRFSNFLRGYALRQKQSSESESRAI